MFKRDEIVVLLGAGASVEVDIPHSKKMVEEIEEALEQRWKDYKGIYHYIRSAIYYSEGIKGHTGNKVVYNIERLVENLDELAKRDEHILYPYVGAWNPKLLEVAGIDFAKVKEFKAEIVDMLKNNWIPIKRTEKAEYYRGLINFQEELQHPLRLFTLNYDLCMEEVCRKFLGEYPERGFEGRNWNWRQFDDNDNEPKRIFLYKLHGSIDWQYDSLKNGLLTFLDNASCIKPDELAIIFGTTYKLRYLDPFLFLTYEFRKYTLQSELIICIGYGFGDEHINGIIGQTMNNNQETKLIVVTLCDDECEELTRVISLLKLKSHNNRIVCKKMKASSFMKEHLKIERIQQMFPQARPPFNEV